MNAQMCQNLRQLKSAANFFAALSKVMYFYAAFNLQHFKSAIFYLRHRLL